MVTVSQNKGSIMGNYIVIGVLFIFFIGSISLLMDSLYKPKKNQYYQPIEDNRPATVILEATSLTDIEKMFD